MKTNELWTGMLIGCALLFGCSSQREHRQKDPSTNRIGPVQSEADLNEDQRKALQQWTSNLKTGNSVADIDRLRDSLKRWDELMMNTAPPEMKPVFAILEERVRERIVELEAEAKSN